MAFRMNPVASQFVNLHFAGGKIDEFLDVTEHETSLGCDLLADGSDRHLPVGSIDELAVECVFELLDRAAERRL